MPELDSPTATDLPSSLAGALIVLQSRLPRITKDKTAEVETQGGRKYRYSYANLASIHELVLPLLGECGLAWTCRPTLREDGTFVLVYTLIHAASGEESTGVYPLPFPATPQAIGSAMTYAKRYAIIAVLGIAPDEDDDDARAAEQEPAAQWRPPANPSGHKFQRSRGRQPDDEWTALPEADDPGSITDRQRSRLMAAYGRAGISARDDRLAYAMSALNLPELASSNDLSMRQAGQLIARLESDGDS